MYVVEPKKMKDTTLIIHGPLKEDTYKFYCTFYPEIPKIFSTWEGFKRDNDWKFSTANMHSAQDILIESRVPNRLGCWERKMELDVVSALVGICRAKTNLLIKLRGDEWYSKLNTVVEAVERDGGEKLFMAPIFLKKWSPWPFKMSDHLLAGLTDNIRLMYETCLSNIVVGSELYSNCWPLPSQSILAKGYVEKKRPCVTDADRKEDFKKLFGLVDLDLLKFYKVNSDSGKDSWYSNFKPSIANLAEI